tara:strand:- start:146628 stop:147425 length:798 start_codon:yes stop_codon:yes gene_type:complete
MSSTENFFNYIESIKGPEVRALTEEIIEFIIENIDEARVDIIHNALAKVNSTPPEAMSGEIYYAIAEMCAHYLSQFGILIADEQIMAENYFVLYEALRLVHEIYTTNQPQDIIGILESDDSSHEIIIECMAVLGERPEDYWCEIIDDVSDETITRLIKRHRQIEDEEVSEEVELPVDLLEQVRTETPLIMAIIDNQITNIEQLAGYMGDVEALEDSAEQVLHLVIATHNLKLENRLEAIKKLVEDGFVNFSKVIRLTQQLESYPW